MLGRFVCVRVRVMTAAPLPGVSPARRGSRGAADTTGGGWAGSAGRETKKKRANSAIPALNRVKSGCGSPCTFDPFNCGTTQPAAVLPQPGRRSMGAD